MFRRHVVSLSAITALAFTLPPGAIQAAANRDPKPALARHDRDLASKARGNLDRVIAENSEAIMRDPNDALAYNNRCMAHYAKGDLGSAIADYREAIKLDPRHARADDRCNAYDAMRELDRAIADASEAIRRDPELALPYYNRGLAYQARGDLTAP